MGNGVTQSAKADLITGYNAAIAKTPVTTVATELGGTTKIAGVYGSASGTFGITGTLILDAQNDPDSLFIFKADSTLIADADTTDVFNSHDGKVHLNLITCGGAWNEVAKSHFKRIVIFTDQVLD